MRVIPDLIGNPLMKAMDPRVSPEDDDEKQLLSYFSPEEILQLPGDFFGDSILITF